MARKSRENPEVRAFILRHVASHSGDIAALTGKTFGLSRATVNAYLQRLVRQEIITGAGNTRARRYQLARTVIESFSLPLPKSLEEHVVWQYRILPHLKALHTPSNVIDIWAYGFTEMLNNAKDHSASANAAIRITHSHNRIEITVTDEGIGIFEKIQRDFHLADTRSALLELSKGKLTSDPKHHAGEGIFYTSRMLDDFSIRSGYLYYLRERQQAQDGWLIETHDLLEYRKGTKIVMGLSMDATWTWRDVFAQFEGDHERFRKTHVPISLGQYAGEALVSRSQAKRVLARFDHFSEVMLDFRGVKAIGQAFADEIFRVFKNAHPGIRIVTVNTSAEIESMIRAVSKNSESS